MSPIHGEARHFQLPTLEDLDALMVSYPYEKEIQEFHHQYLVKDRDVPPPSHLRKFIAEAWQKSKLAGMPPNLQVDIVTKNVWNLNERTESIVQNIVPTLKTYIPLLDLDDQIFFCLYNVEGLALYSYNLQHIMTDADINDVKYADTSIESIGPCCHTLSVARKETLCFIGVENYNLLLQDLPVEIAVPIFCQGEVSAVLLLGYYNERFYEDDGKQELLKAYQYQCMIVQWIESILQTLPSFTNVMEAVGALHSSPVLIIGEDGEILHANEKMGYTFKAPTTSLVGKHYSQYLGKQPRLEALLHEDGRADFRTSVNEVVQLQGKPARTVVVHSLMFKNEEKVLLLKEAKNIHGGPIKREHTSWRSEPIVIVGRSKMLQETRELARRFAKSDNSVLLRGESGTGKELFARTIHELARPTGPFIPLNCAALPESIVESELFGYEGGSFTGAERKGRSGKFEMAHGGTLFLDEIGDMPLNLQATLLRVLDDKQILRIGGKRYLHVDFKVVAATNKDLEKMIEQQTFRADLYYRIATFEISVPPLRHRPEDIADLANYFIEHECQHLQIPIKTLSEEAFAAVTAYDWPGNARELKNVMVYSVHISDELIIGVAHLPKRIRQSRHNPQNTGTMNTLHEIEKYVIEETFSHKNGNITRTAQSLGISRVTLYKKLKEYGVIDD